MTNILPLSRILLLGSYNVTNDLPSSSSCTTDYRLALLYHPDSPHPSSSPQNFSLLNRAYKLLSSPHSRALYHRTGLGWGTANDVLAGRTTTDRAGGMGYGGFNREGDEEMRRQARARAYSYSYSYSYGHPSHGGPAYAGARAGGYTNGNGNSWGGRGGSSYDQTRWGAGAGGPAEGMGNPNPNGNYTTNTRFIGSLVILVSTVWRGLGLGVGVARGWCNAQEPRVTSGQGEVYLC
jgi:curved DNA-binding protein CbpA